MRLLLDSAALDELRTALALVPLDGVTTNPTLLSRAGTRAEDFARAACELVDGPVSVPVRATDAEAIVAEGRRLAQLHDNVVVKIPLHAAGVRALAKLHSEGVRTHATLCCSVNQALLAARAGADFLSPPVGRIDAAGGKGLELVGRILEVYDNFDLDTQVVVASVRSPEQVEAAAVLGADACTVPFDVLQALVRHPLTDELVARFVADAERS